VAFGEGQPEASWNLFEARPIKVQSCIDAGMTMGVTTLSWWLKQKQEACRLLDKALDATTPGMSLGEALYDFIDWFPEGARLWGNGADFDNVLLGAAFKMCNFTPPWRYSNSRCYRTLKAIFKDTVPQPEFIGVKHDALADALHQTRHLQSILLRMKNAEVVYKSACKSNPAEA
jgi:exodeoxyribonuclease VIII